MRQLFCALVILLISTEALCLYRGDEYEPRDWRFDSEYTLDTLTFQFPRRFIRSYRQTDTAYLITAGSIRPEDAYISQHLKFSAELDGPWDFAWRFDMDEDWDGIYEHHYVEFNASLGAGWLLYGIGEPLAQKEFCDIGFGFRYENDAAKLDLTLLWPNLWWNDKNDLDSRVKIHPLNLQFKSELPAGGDALIFPWWDLDFRGMHEYDFDSFSFRFEKYRFGADYELPVGERSFFWAGVSAEYCYKRRWGYLPADPNDYSLRRDAGRIQLEYEWWFSEVNAVTMGFLWNYLNEDEPRPNDPTATKYLLVNEHLPYLAWTHKVNDRCWLKTGLYANWVEWEELYPGDPASNQVFSGWRVKMPFMAIFPGKAGELVLSFNWQVYPNKFGGGNVIFIVEF